MAAFMRGHVKGLNCLFYLHKNSEVFQQIKGFHTCRQLKQGKFFTKVQKPVTIKYVYSRHRQSCLLQHSHLSCGLFQVRWNSSEQSSGSQATSFPEGYIPEPPPIPVPDSTITPETAEAVQQTLNALGEPTLTSLGLAHWTPSGLFQSLLENIHVGLDWPWWGAIVASTILIRLAVFPLVIYSQKNSVHMNNHMPTIQRLQEKFTQARMSGNPLDAAKAADELMSYMKRNNVKPGRQMMVPLAQMPIFVSVFVGLRQMANLPVETLTTGGLLWFTNLTIPDPYYALPFLTMATFLITIELGVDGVSPGGMQNKIKWVLRGMPFVIFPFIINFPTAMCVYWFTSNVFSLVQVSFLKIPKVRKYFNIPVMVKHDQSALGKKKGITKGFTETWENSKLMAQIQDRQRMDAVRFKEAGTGPLQKTYSYDPTKGKKKAAIKS